MKRVLMAGAAMLALNAVSPAHATVAQGYILQNYPPASLCSDPAQGASPVPCAVDELPQGLTISGTSFPLGGDMLLTAHGATYLLQGLSPPHGWMVCNESLTAVRIDDYGLASNTVGLVLGTTNQGAAASCFQTPSTYFPGPVLSAYTTGAGVHVWWRAY